MKTIRLAMLLGILAIFTSHPLSAALITFDFANGNNSNNSQNDGDGNWTPFADETTSVATSASTTLSGLEMTINGVAVDGNGIADEWWGINSQGLGIYTDDNSGKAAPRRIDGTIGEAITFSFDQDVTLTSLRLGSFGGTEVVTVAIDGGATITLDDSSPGPADDISLGDAAVSAGTLVTLTTTTASSGGVLFNEISVNAVPEPSTVLLSSMVLLGLVSLRFRRT